MWCPFCGDQMRSGQVLLRGQWLAGPWAGGLSVNFEVDDGSGEGSQLLERSRFRSLPRAAYCCVRCEAVLVEPKSAEYQPATATTATSAARPADPVDGAEPAEPAELVETEPTDTGETPDTNGSSGTPASSD
jgi:hypothetical protein